MGNDQRIVPSLREFQVPSDHHVVKEHFFQLIQQVLLKGCVEVLLLGFRLTMEAVRVLLFQAFIRQCVGHYLTTTVGVLLNRIADYL
ncbi:hypothetical protein D3C73_1374040 [compost metagenome]